MVRHYSTPIAIGETGGKPLSTSQKVAHRAPAYRNRELDGRDPG